MSYDNFITRKLSTVPATGLQDFDEIAGPLFPHQDPLTRWALRRGRAAIFADTGLGKTRMQLSWADAVHRLAGHDVLILAPLAVAAQTVREGSDMGLAVTHCREQEDVRSGINITNYDRLHKFDCSRFGAVVLDESSIIKHHTSKTLKALLEAFRDTPFKLCATATPAPNDWTELGTHAEFLGICTQQEMLAEYFIHDAAKTQDWRLKGHARDLFWKWVATWAAMVRKPSDLGFDDGPYILPELKIEEHHVETTAQASEGMLFALEASSLMERRDARRASMTGRVQACVGEVIKSWADLSNSEDLSPEKRERHAKKYGALETEKDSTLSAENDIQKTPNGARTSLAKQNADRMDHGETRIFEGLSEFQSQTTTPCSRSRAEDVQSAVTERQTAQADDSRLTIATQQGALEDCSASHAILQLQSYETIRSLLKKRGNTLEPWLIFCDLNDEQDALEKAFGESAFSVRGADDTDEKERRIVAWVAGERPVMISKASIMGFGLNFQHCARVAFVGVTDSWEAYYQAIRRCWRFGQKREVHAHIFASQLEGAIVANLKRKEADAQTMSDALSAETLASVQLSVLGTVRDSNPYQPAKPVIAPSWLRSEAA